MKARLLFALILLSIKSFAQSEEKIVVNNSRMAITTEIGFLFQELSLKGNSKYYNEHPDYDGVNIKGRLGGSIGANVEYHLLTNSRRLSFNFGGQFITYGDPIIISKGSISDNFPKTNDDEIGYLRLSAIRLPVFFFFRLFRLPNRAVGEGEGIGLEIGTNFDFLLNATIVPGKINDVYGYGQSYDQVSDNLLVTEAFRKSNINLFAGPRVQLGRFYMNLHFGIIPSKKIFNNNAAIYSSDSKYEDNLVLNWGIGYYVKK